MRTPTTFSDPVPTRLGRDTIENVAEDFATRHEFFPGDRIEPVVMRLGGRIHYLDPSDSVDAADGSLIVYGPGEFEIFVSAFTGSERDRFTIAHELGHYVLHSDLGRKQIKAARFGTTPVEWEANWFAASFLMPRSDFIENCDRLRGSLERIAARYLVSSAAAKVRMSRLGLEFCNVAP